MIWRILLLGLFGVLAESANIEGPSEFYIVSHYDSDLEGAWNYRILEVSQDGLDSLVRYILITPVRSCPRTLTVRAAETRLPKILPAQLTSSQNPCDGSSQRKDANVPGNAFPTFSMTRAGIVAKCGLEERLATLPQLDALTRQIVDRAFGSREIFWGISEEEDLEPQREGNKLISEIASGRFDKGLNAVFRDGQLQRTFRDVLKDYTGIVKASDFVDRRLVTTNRYQFTKYIEPDYPLLGVAALVLGKVDLQLRIDTSTGEVRNVTVMRGQAELAERASRAAQSWHFEPNSIDSESITVAVDFRFRCP